MCPAGKVATGGGGFSNLVTTGGAKVDLDYPFMAAGSATPTGWTVVFDGTHSSNQARVICAN